MSQVVDTESAKEFMKEAFSQISPEELSNICAALESKSRQFQQFLNAESLPNLSDRQLYQILRSIFSTRRKAQKLLDTFSAENLKVWIDDLLYATDEIGIRFQNFCEHFDNLDMNIRTDLAGELLHFTFPEKYWLWSRWMWDPKVKTGALPLVISEDYVLNCSSPGEGYLVVGEAVAFVHSVGEAAGFQTISRTLFGTDVYLSCVYVVYVYTVLRMRMTQEFNKVMPGLAEFSCRLLGVHRLEEIHAG